MAKRRVRKRRIKKSVKITALVLVILMAGTVFGYYQHLSAQKNRIEAGTVTENSVEEEEFDIGEIEIEDENAEESSLPELKYSILNAGAGESILVEVEDKTVLIDTGNGEDMKDIKSAINEAGGKLDYVIITNNSQGRIGGLSQILKKYSVKNLIVNNMDKAEIRKYSEASEGTIVTKADNTVIDLAERTTIDLITPDTISDDENDKSVITAVHHGSRIFLAESDAGEKEEKKILESFDRADIFVAAGNGDISSNRNIQKFDTKYVIVSEKKDAFKLIARDLYQVAGEKTLYNTGELGNITFTSTNNELLTSIGENDEGYSESRY